MRRIKDMFRQGVSLRIVAPLQPVVPCSPVLGFVDGCGCIGKPEISFGKVRSTAFTRSARLRYSGTIVTVSPRRACRTTWLQYDFDPRLSRCYLDGIFGPHSTSPLILSLNARWLRCARLNHGDQRVLDGLPRL